MIPVNKPYLPAFDKYTAYLKRAYEKNWLTNNGPLVQELKNRLEEFLGVKNLLPVANGTLAMQLAYKVFNLKGNAVTTPFTFIATSSSLAWEGISPRFADVDPQSYNLCPLKAEGAINPDTTAIVPVHVYGNPCNVDAFEHLGLEHGVKVIYDAAHAFGVKVNERSVLSYGDASTLSFHATKVFHSVEGGAVIFRNDEDYERAVLMTNFGINTKTSDIVDSGINTKMSEIHAAMGLACLDDIHHITERRAALFDRYVQGLKNDLNIPVWHAGANTNGAYMPVTFQSADVCSKVFAGLTERGINARRYFAPALNTLQIYTGIEDTTCEVAERLAQTTLCLPLYFDLTETEVDTVISEVKALL